MWQHGSKEAHDGLHLLLRDICNGIFAGKCRKRLLACRLIPLDKKGDGVRPVAIAELVQKVLSTQGVRQGDPFAAPAFALTVQPLYEAALVEAAAGEADGVSIHDDFNVVGSLDQVLHVFRYVQAHSLADFGLELHVDKCQVYIPPETCDALSAEELKAMRHRSAFRRTRSRTAWIRWE